VTSDGLTVRCEDLVTELSTQLREAYTRGPVTVLSPLAPRPSGEGESGPVGPGESQVYCQVWPPPRYCSTGITLVLSAMWSV
jgi:hypothetical protein